jgi:hypothetical protein
MGKGRLEGLQRVGIYVGFAATGVGLTQPGSLMPVLLRRWQLDDGRGGFLLFCLFPGCGRNVGGSFVACCCGFHDGVCGDGSVWAGAGVDDDFREPDAVAAVA